MREWSRNCAGQGAANTRRSCLHTETPKRERARSIPRRIEVFDTQSGFLGPAAPTALVSFLEM